MKYTIEVTQEDIDNGECADATGCPVGLAIGRLNIPKFYGVSHDAVSIGERRILLPPEASSFIKDFDDHKPVSPFTFTIEL